MRTTNTLQTTDSGTIKTNFEGPIASEECGDKLRTCLLEAPAKCPNKDQWFPNLPKRSSHWLIYIMVSSHTEIFCRIIAPSIGLSRHTHSNCSTYFKTYCIQTTRTVQSVVKISSFLIIRTYVVLTYLLHGAESFLSS